METPPIIGSKGTLSLLYFEKRHLRSGGYEHII